MSDERQSDWKSITDSLPEAQRPAFTRLGRELRAYAGRWGLFVLEYAHADTRGQIAAAIERAMPGARRLTADSDRYPDWLDLEQALVEGVAAGAACVQLFGLEHWLDPLAEPQTRQRLRAMNRRREGFSRAVAAPVLLWLRAEQVRELAVTAPDLWSWRAGLHPFPDAPAWAAGLARVADPAWAAGLARVADPAWAAGPAPRAILDDIDNRSAAQRQARIDDLRAYLEHAAPLDNQRLELELNIELARLLVSLGDYDAAQAIYESRAIAIATGLGDAGAVADTRGEIADILQTRGDLDAALRIREQEILPVYERLGDVRSAAITRGRIADILEARGDLDAALRIREQEILPVFERLGDVRSAAITRGRIADSLEARGDLDAALRIREQEILPVFERLGDVREAAITRYRIADIMHARGDLDAALRIREQEILPVFERLGDVRSAALTRCRIADSLEARGDLDAALRIREQEILPVFERLGDVREAAITRGQIANSLHARGDLDAALRIREQEILPVFERLGDVRSAAITRGQIADSLAAHGFRDAALRRYQASLTGAEQLQDPFLIALYRLRWAQTRMASRWGPGIGSAESDGAASEADASILAESFATFRRLGRPDWQAEAGCVYGGWLLAQGDVGQAESVLAEAATAAQKIGRAGLLAKIAALRGQLDLPPDGPAAAKPR